MTAREVKDALRRRHPAVAEYGGPGPWTTLEEWANIDLLAFSAWSSKKPPIVGYEVKVSRSDYRRELLKPEKRTAAVAGCWQFWFAVPKGLLTKEEKAYVEPEHFRGQAFVRDSCPERCSKIKGQERRYLLSADARRSMQLVTEATAKLSGSWWTIPSAYGDAASSLRGHGWGDKKVEVRGEYNPDDDHYNAGGPVQEWRACTSCDGRGYTRKSVVEEEAPTLWVPNDVGLIEVHPNGRCHVVRKAPLEEPTHPIGDLCQLVRWVSFRPDPRHVAEAERQANGGFLLEEVAA